MRIYFAGAILGGRDDLATYQHIVARLTALGHQVPSAHVARPHVLAEEADVGARAVYERDLGWIRACDAMIAEVSTPSLGVGYEIASAERERKPVLCVHREGLAVSKMITGNPSPLILVSSFRDAAELDRHIDRFLARVSSAGRPER